jgi:hypothetical protein
MTKIFLILLIQLITVVTAIAQNAEKDCLKTDKEFFLDLCAYVDNRGKDNEGDGRNFHYYQTFMEMTACVIESDPDSIRIKKVQSWWNKYDCKCNRTNFTIYSGSILKYAVQTSFDSFIYKIINFYKLDINFIDHSDGKTVLDFAKKEYDRLYNLSKDHAKTKSSGKIVDFLRSNGALYASELSAKN